MTTEKQCEAYLKLIESFLRCLKGGNLSELLNANQELIDYDLVRTMIQIATHLKERGYLEDYTYLMSLATQLLVLMGNSLLTQKHVSQARKFYEQSLTIAEQIDVEAGKILEVDILNTLGSSYNHPHDWNLDKTIEVCQKSLEIARTIGYRPGEAVALSHIGKAYCWYPGEKRNFPEAIKCYEQAKTIFQETQNFQGLLESLFSLQESYYYTSNYTKAIQSNEECLGLARKLNNSLLEAKVLFDLGTNYEGLGSLHRETAKEYYEKCLEIAKTMDSTHARWLQVRSLQGLGSYHRFQGNLADAEKAYQESLNISQNIQAEQGEANALRALAEIYDYQGNLEQAWNYDEQSLKIEQKFQDRKIETYSYCSK